MSAQRYYFAYQEPMPVEQLVRSISDTKQVRLPCMHVPPRQHAHLLSELRAQIMARLLLVTALSLCWSLQGYTQFGGQRPFGVSVLYAGW